MILGRLFEGESVGFYVDVGAHHPRRFSNTFIFYERGWRGINIDPNPDALAQFERLRPRDIHLVSGISDEPGTLRYFRFDDPALNTFDADLAEQRIKLGFYRILATVPTQVSRLQDILAQYLPPEQSISFLSIDVEGYDLKVLRSNDWQRYRPRYVLSETIGASVTGLASDPQCQFLQRVDYEPFAKTLNTVIYRDRRVNF